MDEKLQKARHCGLGYLAGRDRSVREVRGKLRQEGFAPRVADQVIADLERLGLLDDRKFARRWLEARLATRPAAACLLARELERRGLDPELVAAVLAEFAQELGSDSAPLGLLRRQKRRYAGLEEEKAKRRMYGFLLRRGYGQEAALKAVEQAWEEMQNDDLEGDQGRIPAVL